MQQIQNDEDSRGEEIVYVLRVRCCDAGWRGQVQRLDEPPKPVLSRYVGGFRELYELLERDWQLERSTRTELGPA